jgi:transposase
MPVAPERALPSQGVVIAVDPHKASWTAVVVTAGLAAAGAVRVEASRAGYRQLRRFAAGWPDLRWAIEGAAGLGAPLAGRLREDQIAVLDVPAKLARRVRLLSTGHGRKSDPADPLSVGIAAWSAPALHSVEIDQAIAALRAVTEVPRTFRTAHPLGWAIWKGEFFAPTEEELLTGIQG